MYILYILYISVGAPMLRWSGTRCACTGQCAISDVIWHTFEVDGGTAANENSGAHGAVAV